LLGVTRSQYYPQVAYDANIPGQKSITVPNHTYYSYSFTSFWEIDLFGRIRKMTEAQRAVYFASEEARRDVRLLIMSQVAQGYFQLRALDAQVEISRRTVKSFQDTLDIFQHRLEGGYASGLETSRAQAALSNVAATIPDLQSQIVAQEKALDCFSVDQKCPQVSPHRCWSAAPTCARQNRTSSPPTPTWAWPRQTSSRPFRCPACLVASALSCLS
jgi:outer membrane protein TolC